MSDDYQRITTTPEVWAVLRASHGKSLRVFSSYSNPSGNDGLSSERQMMTEYGLPNTDFPIIGAKTTWEQGEKEHDRVNVKTEYWLCVAKEMTYD